jgi:hypothetical protein
MRYIRNRYPRQIILPPGEEDDDDPTEYDWVGLKRASKRRPVLYEIWIDIQNSVKHEGVGIEVVRRGTKGGESRMTILLVSFVLIPLFP